MRLPYKAMEAFAPVSLVATGPLCMVAHKDTPYQTFRDVVEAAKRKPGDINYATSGVGGLAHVATTLLQQQGGFQLAHVPYRGAGPAVQDAMAGHVPLFMSNVVVISQHIKAGTLAPARRHHARRDAARPRRAELRPAGLRRLRGADLVGDAGPRARAGADRRSGCTEALAGVLADARRQGEDRGAGRRRRVPRRRRSAAASSAPRSRSGAR